MVQAAQRQVPAAVKHSALDLSGWLELQAGIKRVRSTEKEEVKGAGSGADNGAHYGKLSRCLIDSRRQQKCLRENYYHGRCQLPVAQEKKVVSTKMLKVLESSRFWQQQQQQQQQQQRNNWQQQCWQQLLT